MFLFCFSYIHIKLYVCRSSQQISNSNSTYMSQDNVVASSVTLTGMYIRDVPVDKTKSYYGK